jgi:hypothetical protein
MANYIAIFTIYGGTDQDYTALRRLLERAGFSKTITDDQNVRYYLPPHTYFTSTERDKTHVIEVGKNVVSRLRKRYSLFVTKSDGSTWVGLERA